MIWLSSIDRDLSDLVAPSVSRLPGVIPLEIHTCLNCPRGEWQRILRRRKIALKWESSTPNRVDAEYFPEEGLIELTVMIGSTDYDPRDDLIRTYLHELIHLNQFSVDDDVHYYPKIGGRNANEFENYLSLTGEIEAYGHCLFTEAQDQSIELCDTYQLYADTDLRVFRKLMQQAKKWQKIYSAAGIQINNPI